MATVRPFRALRPVAEAVADFASLPYDVMDTAEAREMVARKPRSFLRVTRSEVDLPPETDPDEIARCAAAAARSSRSVSGDVTAG